MAESLNDLTPEQLRALDEQIDAEDMGITVEQLRALDAELDAEKAAPNDGAEKAAAFALRAGDSLAFGLGNELAAGAETAAGLAKQYFLEGKDPRQLSPIQDYKKNYATYVDATLDAKETQPGASLAGDLTGGIISGVATGGQGAMIQGALQGAGAEGESLKERAMGAGVGAALGGVLGKFGAKGPNKAAAAEILGVKPAIIEKALATEGRTVLTDIGAVAKKGLLNGNTKEAFIAVSDDVARLGPQVDDIIQGYAAKAPGQAFVEIPLKDIQGAITEGTGLSGKGLQRTTNRFMNDYLSQFVQGDMVRIPLEASNTVKKNLYSAAETAYEAAAAGRPLSVPRKAFMKINSLVRKGIEDKTGPEVAKLNQELGASLNVQKLLEKTLNKGKNINPNRVVAAGQELAGAQLTSPFQAIGKVGSAINQVVRSPQSVSSQLGTGVVSRTTKGVLSHLQQNPALLGNTAPAVLQEFVNLPDNQKEEMAYVAIQAAKAQGIPVEPSASGLNSEFNGKLLDEADRQTARAQIDKNPSLSLIQKAREVNGLNRDKTLPPSLVPQAAAPQPQQAPSPIPQPVPYEKTTIDKFKTKIRPY
jgi:hypothetical protein